MPRIIPFILRASILSLLVFTACKKRNESTAPNAAVDIYVLGTSNDSLLYWKSGQPTLLPAVAGYQAYGSGIAVSGSNVYACGGSSNIQFEGYGTLWFNGVASPLADTTGNAINSVPNVIFVNGPDVYVAGVVNYDTTHGIPYIGEAAAPAIIRIKTAPSNSPGIGKTELSPTLRRDCSNTAEPRS
jgi:hypothetical protein